MSPAPRRSTPACPTPLGSGATTPSSFSADTRRRNSVGDRKGERGSRRAVGRRVRSPLPSATGGGRREGDEALRRDARVAELEARLGLRFPDPRRLLEALTHSSYSYEQGPHRFPSNERLEFLGDGVVNLAVAHKLWNELPQHAEGDLTRLRAALVRESTLARWARQLELDRFVL